MSEEKPEEIPKSKWFIEFPTYRYNENVRVLAAKNGLQIVNAKYKNDSIGKFAAPKVPKLTLKDEYLPKEIVAANADAIAKAQAEAVAKALAEASEKAEKEKAEAVEKAVAAAISENTKEAKKA